MLTRTAMHHETGHLLEQVGRAEVHRHVVALEQRRELIEPFGLQQDRPRTVAGAQRPFDHLGRLGQVQPTCRLAEAAQDDVRQPDVVAQALVGGVVHRYDVHPTSTARRNILENSGV